MRTGEVAGSGDSLLSKMWGTYLVFYPPSVYDPLKYHLQFCEGKSEDD